MPTRPVPPGRAVFVCDLNGTVVDAYTGIGYKYIVPGDIVGINILDLDGINPSIDMILSDIRETVNIGLPSPYRVLFKAGHTYRYLGGCLMPVGSERVAFVVREVADILAEEIECARKRLR